MSDTKWATTKQDQMQRTLNEIQKLEVRNTDIFLMGYPKSGTTWAQELIWLLVNDLNYRGAEVFVDERIPVLELSGMYDKYDPNQGFHECHINSVKFVSSMKDPRCIKTHLRWDFLPQAILSGAKKPKIIYIARNPKDVCVSTFYYCINLLKTVDCSIEDFCHEFLKRDSNPYKNYWDHVLNMWNRRDQPNILFIRYEDMKSNLSSVIQNVAKFLGKTISKEEEINLIKWLDFETMKNNPAVNHVTMYKKTEFIRTGKVGDHKNVMSDEMVKTFDSWIEEHIKNTDYVL